MNSPLKITAIWDEEAMVWVAESADVPGLAAEAESLPALRDKLAILIPELLEDNLGIDCQLGDHPFELIAQGTATTPSSTA